MKKIISITMTVLLVASMMLMLTGCGGDKKQFVGEWTCKLDMTDLINQSIAEDPETAEYIKLSDFTIVLDYKFNDDGTYSITSVKEECDKAYANLRKDFAAGFEAALLASLKEMGSDMSVEDALKLSNTSIDAVIDEAFGQAQFDELVKEFEYKGNFKAVDGKLYCTDGLDSTFDMTTYEKYEIVSEKEIKLTEFVESDADEESEKAAKEVYPMTLTKK